MKNCIVSVRIRCVKFYAIICEFSYSGTRKILRTDFVTCTQARACVLCAEHVQFCTLHCTFGKIKSHQQGGEFRYWHSYFLRIGKCSFLRLYSQYFHHIIHPKIQDLFLTTVNKVGCEAVWSIRNWRMFQWNEVPPSSDTIKMEVVSFTEVLASFYQHSTTSLKTVIFSQYPCWYS
jgi:hypothetical protein